MNWMRTILDGAFTLLQNMDEQALSFIIQHLQSPPETRMNAGFPEDFIHVLQKDSKNCTNLFF